MALSVSIEDFPGPDEVEGFWAYDNHMTAPMTPLSIDAVGRTIAEGFTQAQAEYDTSIMVTPRFEKGFFYVSFHPIPDEEEAARRWSRYEQTLAEKVPGVGARWQFEWKPEVIALNSELRVADWTTLSDTELAEKLDWFIDHMRYQWYIHGHINYCLMSASAFCDFYDEVVQPESKTESYQCLQGFRTRSVDTGTGLWKLSRIVRDNAELRTLFESTPLDELPAALAASDAAAEFNAEFADFLAEFGWRSGGVYDMFAETWIEDPSVPLRSLMGYLDMDDADNPELHLARAEAKRETQLAKCRQLLADDPDKLAHFNDLYEAAQYNLPVTEDHAFWIDQTGVAVFRRFVGEIGRRLAESGVVADADDVHFLYVDELRDAMANGTKRDAELAARREEHAAYSTISPPPILGTPPPPPPADAPFDPFMDALVVRLLGMVPPDPDAVHDENVLTGVTGSPGTATGRARVVTTLAQATELEEGEILVCPMTLPPWVPLFSIASAVVADTGGVLSHCAIVAREMGIPAVVGTQMATSMITTGQMITVNGDDGTVLLDV
jgi:rifampicin phosphotransferase